MKDVNEGVPGVLEFGLVDDPQLAYVPDGVIRVRWRMRAGEYLRVYLKYADRIEEWIPLRVGGNRFILRYAQGCNHTTQGEAREYIGEIHGMSTP